jgi:hypothetical protein
MANYDSIHLPPWRARARRTGVRSNPGGDPRQARSQMPAGPAFPPEFGVRTARFAAAGPSSLLQNPRRSSADH